MQSIEYSVCKVIPFNEILYLIEIKINKHSLEPTIELSGYSLLDKVQLTSEFLNLKVL